MKSGQNHLHNSRFGEALKVAFPKTIPVMTGYLFLGFSFALLLSKQGYGLEWSLLMSGCIYAGSLQFAALSWLSSGPDFLLTAALMAFLINARHLMYGISMIKPYKKMGHLKPYLAFALTDETYSLVCSGKVPEGINEKSYYFIISALDHLYWILGSALGSLAGHWLSLDLQGIEFSMTALFVVIVTEQWRNKQNRFGVMIGIETSFICLLLFGKSYFLIPSMILILFSLLIVKNPQEKENNA